MSAELTEETPFTPGDTYQGAPVQAVAVRAPGPLTVAERAAAVFAAVKSEEELKALAKESATIVTITNQAGYDQCHASRMVLKNTRLEIARTGEVGREDAVQTSKGIIAIQKARIAIISPEEERLAAIEKAWDDRIEAEKEAKIQAEIARVAEIQRRIDGIRNWPINAANQPSMLVGQMLAQANAYRIEPEVFEEHADAAQTVLTVSIAALTGILQQRKDHEAKEAQLEIDRKELIRLKAEEAERQAKARDEQARKDAEAQAERDAEAARQAAADKANRERNEMALQEIQAIHHQLIIADTGRAPYCKGGDLESIDWAIDGTEKWELTEDRFGVLYVAAVKTKETTLTALRQKRVDFIARQENVAEAQRQAAEQAEVDRKNEEEWKRQAKENERIAAARAQFEAEQEAARKAAEPKPEPVKTRTVERPSARQLIDLVAKHYGVSIPMATQWIRHVKVELEQAA